MAHFHAVVWIDHRGAHIHSFNWEEAEETLVRHEGAPHRIHAQAAETPGAQHAHADKDYLAAVAKALAPYQSILIVGPSLTKTELKNYIDREAPGIASRVVGVEALEQLHEGELLDYSRRYFRRVDKMTPQRGTR